LGPGGLHLFRYNPSLRAAVITPPEPTAANQRSSAAGVAFASTRVARLPDLCSRGLHDVRYLRPAASLPGLVAGFVRRHRAVLSPLQRVSSAS
jgi:hypothetical protein